MLAKEAVNPLEKKEVSEEVKFETPTKIPRIDWLTPLFKSPREEDFYQALRDVFPTYFIYPNVALSNIFRFDLISNYLNQEEKSYYFKAVIDFVVYDPTDSLMPKYFFEVDSSFHDTDEANIRDMKKNNIFSVANIPLFRVRLESNTYTPRSTFVDKIRKVIGK